MGDISLATLSFSDYIGLAQDIWGIARFIMKVIA